MVRASSEQATGYSDEEKLPKDWGSNSVIHKPTANRVGTVQICWRSSWESVVQNNINISLHFKQQLPFDRVGVTNVEPVEVLGKLVTWSPNGDQ